MTRKKKPTASLVRSSAAEYLTFVAASGTGGVEDNERLKRGGSVLSDKYFEEQLQRIREIRLSERSFG